MARNKREDMGFLQVGIGLCFFLNPLFSFVDLLPDFIGCLFLFSGLSRVLFLDVRAQDARRSLRLIFVLSAVRLLCTPVFLWSASSQDAGNTNLLLSFSFATISLLLELSVVKNIFEMYNYLTVRGDSQSAIRHLASAQSILTIFVVVKNVASALPDFLTLFAPSALLEYNPGSARAEATFAFAKMLAYLFLTVAVFVFGIVVATRLFAFFRAARREEDFLLRLEQTRCEVEEADRGLRLRFVLTGALSQLVLMALFSFDYYFDYVSVLPTFLVFLLGAYLLYRLRVYSPVRAGELVFAAIGFLTSLAAYVYRLFYSDDVFIGLVFHTKPLTVVLGVAQSLFCFAFFAFCAARVCRTVAEQSEIDLAPQRNAAILFALINAAMSAYHYILPKSLGVTYQSEAIVFFAIVIGVVFLVFTVRMETAFQKAAEWKSF